MSDEIDVYMDTASAGQSYVESLIACRVNLDEAPVLLKKLDEVIMAELELALLGTEKAKSEILKKGKNNIKPITGDAS